MIVVQSSIPAGRMGWDLAGTSPQSSSVVMMMMVMMMVVLAVVVRRLIRRQVCRRVPVDIRVVRAVGTVVNETMQVSGTRVGLAFELVEVVLTGGCARHVVGSMGVLTEIRAILVILRVRRKAVVVVIFDAGIMVDVAAVVVGMLISTMNVSAGFSQFSCLMIPQILLIKNARQWQVVDRGFCLTVGELVIF